MIAWLKANGLFALGTLFERVVVAACWIRRIECTVVPLEVWEHTPVFVVVSSKVEPKGSNVIGDLPTIDDIADLDGEKSELQEQCR